MQKNYIVTLIALFMFLIPSSGFSQTTTTKLPPQEHIEGLSIYPNPVSNGRLYINITSKQGANKTVDIYNVLGKKIYSTLLIGKELNIAQLTPGVYILKITENNISEARKLVIK